MTSQLLDYLIAGVQCLCHLLNRLPHRTVFLDPLHYAVFVVNIHHIQKCQRLICVLRVQHAQVVHLHCQLILSQFTVRAGLAGRYIYIEVGHLVILIVRKQRFNTPLLHILIGEGLKRYRSIRAGNTEHTRHIVELPNALDHHQDDLLVCPVCTLDLPA